MNPRFLSFFSFTFLFIAGVISPACFGKSVTAPAVSYASYEAVDLLHQSSGVYIVRYKDDIWSCQGTLNGQKEQLVLMDVSQLSTSRGCKISLAFEVVIFQALENASGELLVFKVTRDQKPWLCRDTNSEAAKKALLGYKAGEAMRMPVKLLNTKCNEATT